MYQKSYNTHQSLRSYKLMLQILGASCEGMSTGGTWLLEEKQWHINALELKAILVGLKSFIKQEKIQIKVFSDSASAIRCINKIGTSHSDICHYFTKLIWEWAEKKAIHITAAHIPRVKNKKADRESRSYQLT